MPDADDTVVTDVSFASDRISAAEEATAVVTVRNPQSTADTHLVELELFGEVVNSEEVTVPAGGTATVTFVHNIVAPGTYTARVDSETASIRVVEPDGPTSSPASEQTTTSTTFPGFGLVITLLALAFAALGVARRT
jgi:hypothetical protein